VDEEGGQAGSVHEPVLLNEVLENLSPRSGGLYIDGTLGAGGHAKAVLDLCEPGGRLLGLDRDPQALAVARSRLEPCAERAVLLQGSYASLEVTARRHAFADVQGILLDLGLSSLQLADAQRGFSFKVDAPLDMRYDPAQEETADDLVNGLAQANLANLLYRYGEEWQSRRIARAIVAARPIVGTAHLAEVIAKAKGRRGRKGHIHPATKSFQALRIAVNHELEALEEVLPQAVRLLAQGGRLVVISFHSLEDRIVKQFMRRESRDCICPPEIPECVCGHLATLKTLTRRPIRPSSEEVSRNPRSRSARMRVAGRLPCDGNPSGAN